MLVLNTVLVNAVRPEPVARPGVLVVLVVGLVAWTGLLGWWYADADRRTPLALAVDMAVALAALAVGPVVLGEGWGATVPGFWVMTPVLAWAARWRRWGGLAGGVLVGGTDLLVRLLPGGDLTRAAYGNVFLLLVGGPIVGYLVSSLQRVVVERDRAERAAAAAAERARLARAVHDGVLQVLALVQRRGRELGGEGAELARLAGEQEVALRGLIRAQDELATARPGGSADLTAALAALAARPRTTVALPGGPVLLPADAVDELSAAVLACLDNVDRHAGALASAWVLLEELPDRVEVSVRDDGPGVPEGRLAAAEAEGRLGVTGSIEGRLRDLGGTARLSTGSWGTEWTLAVPRPADPGAGTAGDRTRGRRPA